MALHIGQCSDLILQPKVGSPGKTKSSESIIDSDDHTTPSRKIAAVIPRSVSSAISERATMNPHQNWQPLCTDRSENIER